MFCGTGKSRIITNVIMHEDKALSVVVFPSLALINQYATDYLNHADYHRHFKKYKTLNVSSEFLTTISSTTSPTEIKKFLKSKSPKIILVTYQSFQVLLSCLEEQKIGVICYDEAHHVVSLESQKLVFGTPYFEKEVFFTATPRNENGMTMFDRYEPANNMCGPLAFEYTYLQGLEDEVLNEFEVCVDMYTTNTNRSIYEAMARTILKRDTGRCLTFHSGVHGESNTNVWNFVNENEFAAVFAHVQQTEFPEKMDFYQKISFKGMDGNTASSARKAMLQALDETPNNEIYIISSCETMGEGVDTKKANMCVFADPKSSLVKIIQNIGRVVRRTPDQPLSSILIPCFVNMENYAAAQGDQVKQDEIIREQMRSEKGDYAAILNVLAALRQEDPELYEMCLNYPKREMKENSLLEQGFRIADDEEEYEDEEYSADLVEQMKNDGAPLEIHTNETIERFNEESEKSLLRLYYDEEMDVYKPIVRTGSASAGAAESSEAESSEAESSNSYSSEDFDDRQTIQVPRKRVGMSFHRNTDIEMLWRVKGEVDFSKKFCSAVIQCNVSYGVERWRLKKAQLIAYMDKEEKCPSSKDKNPAIKKLGSWLSDQKTNYTKNIKILSNPEIRLEWEATLVKYRDYLVCDNEKQWRLNHTQLIAYMDKEKKSPSQNDENPAIKKLGKWLSDQKTNYTKNIYIMSNPEIRLEWEATLVKYRDYLGCVNEEQWRLNHAQLIAHMDKEQKSPSTIDKNPVIKKLGNWLSNQKQNYAKNTLIMSNPDIRAEWEATLVKYGHYLCDQDDKWRLTLAQLIAYMDKEKKAPSTIDQNPAIKKLGSWVGTQKQNYKKNLNTISNSDIRAEWEATLVKYGEYLVCDYEEQWRLNHAQLIAYMDKEKKAPSTIDKNPVIKKLGNWVSMQKQNYKKNLYTISNSDIRAEWESTLEKYRDYLEPVNTSNRCVCGGTYSRPTSKKKHIKSKKHQDYIKNQQTPTPPKKRTKKQSALPIATASVEAQTPPHNFPPPSDIGVLHQSYLRMRADTLHEKFKTDPQLWRDYHATRKRNFATFEADSIPSNQIIQELEKIQTKRQKVVVDMGCGEAPIAHHFLGKNDPRFVFQNYDHQSGGDPLIQCVDISGLPLEDASVEIGMMSLALWGTQENCAQYIKEAYRVLESGGKFYISDSTKRWSPEPLTPENGGELLRNLLTSQGFKIISESIGTPFCLFVCSKVY